MMGSQSGWVEEFEKNKQKGLGIDSQPGKTLQNFEVELNVALMERNQP